MTGRKSAESARREDPLSLAYAHEAHYKSRSKSSGSSPVNTNDHFSGLYRCGRIMTSIFDRGRHMKYDYHVSSRSSNSEERRNSTLAAAYAEAVNGSTKTSRSSSMTESTLPVIPFSTSSTRTSSESSECRRKRRDGMSVN